MRPIASARNARPSSFSLRPEIDMSSVDPRQPEGSRAAEHPHERRLDVDRDTFRALLEATPVDAGYAADLEAMREEEPAGDPWDRP